MLASGLFCCVHIIERALSTSFVITGLGSATKRERLSLLLTALSPVSKTPGKDPGLVQGPRLFSTRLLWAVGRPRAGLGEGGEASPRGGGPSDPGRLPGTLSLAVVGGRRGPGAHCMVPSRHRSSSTVRDVASCLQGVTPVTTEPNRVPISDLQVKTSRSNY